jgi:hypothetical protein
MRGSGARVWNLDGNEYLDWEVSKISRGYTPDSTEKRQ